MAVEMKVAALYIDESTNAPILVLKSVETERILPIYIGLLEASAIAMQLESIELGRPMTHDLFKSILEALGGSLLKVEIHDIRENTYYAWLYIQHGSKVIQIDSRPSDAIALALRTGAPIWARAKVLAHADTKPEGTPPEPTGPQPIVSDDHRDTKEWKELLENLDPEDFGKYKM